MLLKGSRFGRLSGPLFSVLALLWASHGLWAQFLRARGVPRRNVSRFAEKRVSQNFLTVLVSKTEFKMHAFRQPFCAENSRNSTSTAKYGCADSMVKCRSRSLIGEIPNHEAATEEPHKSMRKRRKNESPTRPKNKADKTPQNIQNRSKTVLPEALGASPT